MEDFGLERSVLGDLNIEQDQAHQNSNQDMESALEPPENESNMVSITPSRSQDDMLQESATRQSSIVLTRGKPDDYYTLSSVLIRPEDARLQREYEQMPVNIRIFMETTKNSREEAKFPHCIGSMASILPPFPHEKFMGMWYERVKSCVEEEAHQEHCSNDMDYAGKDRINDADYRLANKVVAIHSQ